MARLFRAKVLWHIHGGGFEEFVQSMRGIRRTLLGLAFSMSEGVIVLSESWRMRLSRHLHPSRWMVVANGVTLPSPGPGVTRSVIFLFVGTLDNKKGAEDLVVATAIAKRNGFHGRVQMAGGETATGQRRRLQRLIAKAGVRERIELLGMVSGERKAAAFEEACVFVLPSYVEGLPIAVLEAMAYGLPVIVTEVGAIPEVVTDSVHGFLIKPGDVEALADCMTRLFADRALRERMGMAARRRIEERYTVEAMASKIIDVYRSAMEP